MKFVILTLFFISSSFAKSNDITEFFHRLPATAFDSTMEGMSKEEKNLLLKKPAAGCWRKKLQNTDTIIFSCSPGGGRVTLHLYQGKNQEVLGVFVEYGQKADVTFWKSAPRKSDLIQTKILSPATLEDFLGNETPKNPPRQVFTYSLEKNFDIVSFPVTWMESFWESRTPKNSVRYSWADGTFKKNIKALR